MQCNVLTAIDRVTNATLLKDGRYGTEDAALGDEFEVKVNHKKWLIKEEGAEVKWGATSRWHLIFPLKLLADSKGEVVQSALV